jgi:hypothetical protein
MEFPTLKIIDYSHRKIEGYLEIYNEDEINGG